MVLRPASSLLLLLFRDAASALSSFLPGRDFLQRHAIATSSSNRCSMALRTFDPQELQVSRFLGELGFIEITDWEYYGGRSNPLDPTTPTRTWNTSGTAVRLFDAKTSKNERVILKEFLPDMRDIAMAEAEMHERLTSSWEARHGEGAGEPPVAALMGSLVADDTFGSRRFIEKWVGKFPTVTPPRPGNIWLVFRWDGLSTFAGFPGAKQEREFFDLVNPAGKWVRRGAFVREMMRGALEATAFLHEAGVVHRSIGSSSFRMSSTDERFPNSLQVRLADLGFASRVAELDDGTLRRAMRVGASSPLAITGFVIREDLYALGYVFLELVFSAMADTGAGGAGSSVMRPSDQNAFKRLVEDIYCLDVKGRFRAYCAEEESWTPAVRLLDERDGAGWELIEALVACRQVPSLPSPGARLSPGASSAVARTTRAAAAVPLPTDGLGLFSGRSVLGMRFFFNN